MSPCCAAYNRRSVRVTPGDMQTDSGIHGAPQAIPAAGEEFRWLPVSRARRVLLGLALAALAAFVFNAYHDPNLVFDLANMVFCG